MQREALTVPLSSRSVPPQHGKTAARPLHQKYACGTHGRPIVCARHTRQQECRSCLNVFRDRLPVSCGTIVIG